MEYIYIALVYITTITLFFAFTLSISAPTKIRILSLTSILILSLRYIALLICMLYDNITIVYRLRYIYYFNVISLPIIILIIGYIVLRNNKIKFYNLIIISGIYVIIVSYIIIFITGAMSLEVFANNIMGYRFLSQYRFLDIIYGIINLSSLIFVLVLLNNSYKNISSLLIIVSSLVSIVEVIFRLMDIDILPQYIFGELLWVLTFIYILKQLKKFSIK